MATLGKAPSSPGRNRPPCWLSWLSMGVLLLLIPVQLATGFLYTYGVWGCLLLLGLLLLRTGVPRIPQAPVRQGVGVGLWTLLLLELLAGTPPWSGVMIGDDWQHCTASYGTIYGLPLVFLRAETMIGAGSGCAGPHTVAQVFTWDGSALLLDGLLCLGVVLLAAWGWRGWRVVRGGR